jgi:hypothetical protein
MPCNNKKIAQVSRGCLDGVQEVMPGITRHLHPERERVGFQLIFDIYIRPFAESTYLLGRAHRGMVLGNATAAKAVSRIR